MCLLSKALAEATFTDGLSHAPSNALFGIFDSRRVNPALSFL
jgi:hypothetical protein